MPEIADFFFQNMQAWVMESLFGGSRPLWHRSTQLTLTKNFFLNVARPNGLAGYGWLSKFEALNSSKIFFLNVARPNGLAGYGWISKFEALNSLIA